MPRPKRKDKGVLQLPMDALWSTEQVAQYLGVSPRTVENWRVRGEGPGHMKMPNNLVRYKPVVVQSWAEGAAP